MGRRVPGDNVLPDQFQTVAAVLASDWCHKTFVFLPMRGHQTLESFHVFLFIRKVYEVQLFGCSGRLYTRGAIISPVNTLPGPFAGIITVAHLTLLLWCSYQTRDRPFPFSKSIFLEDIHQQKRPQLDNSESMSVCKLPRKPAGEAELFTSSALIVVRKSFIFFDSLCFLFVVFLFHINKVINKLSLMKN